MAPGFTLIETTKTPLWDFGWFDLSRFKVDGLCGARPDGLDVLRAFLRDEISQRGFYTRTDPWGIASGLHGPFPLESLKAEWYRSLSIEEVRQRVATILDDDVEFTSSPPPEQRLPVSEWLDAVGIRGDRLLVLEAPDLPGVRVEWDVWLLFHEFVSVSPTREEMTVAVIGYD